MIDIELKTKFERDSKITKLATISTHTRWSAKVTRFGLFENVTWAIYAGHLVMHSGKAFFFKEALQEAVEMLNLILRDRWYKF